jgi:hypothetical protein
MAEIKGRVREGRIAKGVALKRARHEGNAKNSRFPHRDFHNRIS